MFGILVTFTEQLSYNSQSPDEAALVSAAKNFGFVFKVSDFSRIKFCFFFSFLLSTSNTRAQGEKYVICSFCFRIVLHSCSLCKIFMLAKRYVHTYCTRYCHMLG